MPSSASMYAFSACLTGHASDVRALDAYTLPDGRLLLLSGSRDQTARLWTAGADGAFHAQVLEHGSGFVNAVCFFHDGTALYALMSGQDALVYAFEVHTGTDVIVAPTPRYSLVGHASNVCSLRSFASEYFASSSWDGTVRIWKQWECVATLAGHTQSVWSVLPVDTDRVLSASADKSVRLWSIASPTEPLAHYDGATQAVRDLALLPSGAFVSAGNDGYLRWYAVDGSPTAMATCPAFVYSLAVLPSDQVASSGEDRCVRIWDGSSLLQVLPVPALSVWCVHALSNGDVVCGASDGCLYLFTCSEERRASAEKMAAYTEHVETQSLSASEVQGVRSVDAPEALLSSGSTEGEALLLRQGSRTERYQWSTHTHTWQRTGLVTEGAAPSKKCTWNGKEYDYVFDVDISEGAPPLKLAYNVSENPYVAASRFLETNDLPASFLDQVVRFLEKNTESVHVSPQAPADPYTGEGRYVPEAPPASGAPAPVPTKLTVLPQKAYQFFTHIQLGAAHAKILDMSKKESAAPLNSDDQQALQALVTSLETRAEPIPVEVLSRLLRTWPVALRFPLLDLLRAAACYTCTQSYATLISDALIGAEWDALDTPGLDQKVAGTNSMLALRTLANGFAAPSGPTTMDTLALEALATLQSPPWAVLNRHGHTALATVAYNYSIRALEHTSFEHAGLLEQLIMEVRDSTHTQILSQPPSAIESECVYRALMALGNLVRCIA
ncbi:hypothetical protein MEQU1_001923 [Malassezia equina]|uniref:Phospholipase A-2-activating protein n=1 Tax=Malassezia equina TaxID=1381935 RepID=A0AAF0ECU0_9BASI|nr:hypothetical protein MEQU1_001923 [Malassezia equina]